MSETTLRFCRPVPESGQASCVAVIAPISEEISPAVRASADTPRVSARCYISLMGRLGSMLEILTLVARTNGETRHKLGWSQRELSRRSGVTQSRISAIERAVLPTVRLEEIDRLYAAMG